MVNQVFFHILLSNTQERWRQQQQNMNSEKTKKQKTKQNKKQSLKNIYKNNNKKSNRIQNLFNPIHNLKNFGNWNSHSGLDIVVQQLSSRNLTNQLKDPTTSIPIYIVTFEIPAELTTWPACKFGLFFLCVC